MKRVMIVLILGIYLIGLNGLISATTYGGITTSTPLGGNFNIGEWSCEHTLNFESINTNIETIYLRDINTGEEYSYVYSGGQTGTRGGGYGNYKKITINLDDVNYEIEVYPESAYFSNSAGLYIPKRYNFCLNDPRYIEEEEIFTLGGSECQKQFKYSESTGAPIIYEGPNWEEADFTLSGIIYSENNPQWGINDVLGLTIRWGDGNYNYLKRLRKYNLLFVYQENDECACIESWSCASWSTCINNQQTRTCTDSNSCGTTKNKPITSQGCTIGACTEEWSCTNWGSCINNQQTRTCTDSNSCGTINNKPDLSRSCSLQGDEDDDETGNRYGKRNMTKEEFKEMIKTATQERNRYRFEERTGQECSEGCVCQGVVSKCPLEGGGREMTVYARSGNVIIQTKGVNATTTVTLYHYNKTVIAELPNGEVKEIKIMPDQVQEKLKERIRKRIKNYEIILDEDGIYNVQMRKKARLFFIFPVGEKVKAQVDAETGEVIKIRNPWWGFLAKDVSE